MKRSGSNSLAQLEQLRRRGQKPDMPVLIADDGIAAAWGRRAKLLVVDRRDVAEDFTAFAGLDVWIRTAKPFAEVAEFAFALSESARFITLVDSRSRVPCAFVSEGAVV